MIPRVRVLYSGDENHACECAFCLSEKLYADRHEVLVTDISKYLASHLLSRSDEKF